MSQRPPNTPTRIGKEVQSGRTVAKAAIDRGILRLKVVQREVTTYRIKAPEHQGRQLLTEHPRRPDWTLVSPEGKDIALGRRSSVTIGFEINILIPVALVARKQARPDLQTEARLGPHYVQIDVGLSPH